MRPAALGLAAAALTLGVGAAAGSRPERPSIPADTLPRPLPREAPLGVEVYASTWGASEAVVELGRRLFFDPRLSRDGSVACASCHRPELGFADDRPRSVGVDGEETRHHAPSLLNKALSTDLHWDGAAPTLEEQVLLPISSPTEMGLPLEEALERLASDTALLADFEEALGGPPEAERLAAALAAFVRRLVAGDSPVDRFRAGVSQELDAAERAGLWLYEGRGGCWRCHGGPNFSDEGFHNTGVGVTNGVPEAGREAVTGSAEDRGAFRTPGLRHLTRTAPYMHDGSLATLREVVEFYRRGGNPNPSLSSRLQPLDLTDEDVDHLVAFLEALSRQGPQRDERRSQ